MKSSFKKNIIGLAVSVALVTICQTAYATKNELPWYEKIKISGFVAQGWQSAYEVDGGRAMASDEDASSGFQRLRFALHFNMQVSEKISVFAELAEEPNDFSGIDMFGISQDLAWVDYKINQHYTFRIGNLVAYPGSLAFFKYSDGAAVQANPLIGNSPVDMVTAEGGIWLIGNTPISEDSKLAWDVTLSNPSFFADFSKDSGYNYKVNLTYLNDNGFGIGLGAFKTSGDAQCAEGICQLADGGAVNSSIGLGDGDNYEFSTGGPATRATHVAIIPAIDALLWQIDAQYKTDKFMVHGLYGQADDSYSFHNGFGSGLFTRQEAQMHYYSLTGQYYFTNDLYAALRYSASTNESSGVTDNDKLDRLQIGMGYWLEGAALVKIEYVRQNEDANSGGLKTNGVESADWDGISIEASFAF